jgi:hypothetical protein
MNAQTASRLRGRYTSLAPQSEIHRLSYFLPTGRPRESAEVVGEEKAMEADNGIGHRPRRASDSRCLWCYRGSSGSRLPQGWRP